MTKNELPGSIRVWATVVLVAVFIIGAAAGAAIWQVLQGTWVPTPPPMMGPLPMDGLDLSLEQREKMDAIIAAHRPQLDAILAETFPKVQAINEEIEGKFKALLTDEQKKRFETMKAQRPNGPPFPMPPGSRPGRSRHGRRGLQGGPPPFMLDGPPTLDGPPPGAPFGPDPSDERRSPDEMPRGDESPMMPFDNAPPPARTE